MAITLRNFWWHFVIAAILAFLVTLSGCASGTPGLKLGLSFTGSPLGIGISLEPATQYAPSNGFTVGTPGVFGPPATSQPAAAGPAAGTAGTGDAAGTRPGEGLTAPPLTIKN